MVIKRSGSRLTHCRRNPYQNPDELDDVAWSAKWKVHIWDWHSQASRLYTGTLKTPPLQRSNLGRFSGWDIRVIRIRYRCELASESWSDLRLAVSKLSESTWISTSSEALNWQFRSTSPWSSLASNPQLHNLNMVNLHLEPCATWYHIWYHIILISYLTS